MPHNPTHQWEDYEDRYRSDWEWNYPNTPWNDVHYGYRYGWESASDPTYAGRDWADVESDLSSGWDDWQTHQRTGSVGQQIQQTWDELKSSVRHGWEKARNEFEKLT